MPASNVLDGMQRQDRATQARVAISHHHLRWHDEHRTQGHFHGPFPNHAIYESNGPHSSTFDGPRPTHASRDQSEGTVPFPAMFSYLSVPPPSGPWRTHVSVAQQNPYHTLPPPSQILHKVWILDCGTCNTFLTNRGMEAVLLLRPNVSLFSTDALPANCSAYSTNPDAFRPPPVRPPASSRTCECLTQTLCCHTCGTAIGYMIVVPCSRCTSSITANNRATNGHRFVFHSSEVVSAIRYHIPGEPGVFPVEFPLPPLYSPPPLAPAYQTFFHAASEAPSVQLGPTSQRSFLTSSSLSPDSLPSLDSPELSSSSSPPPDSFPFLTPSSPIPHPQSPSLSYTAQLGIGAPTPEARGVPIEHREPPMRKLKAGDTLYWHHLSKTGEIPRVEEDPRARISNWAYRFESLDR